MRLIAKCEKIKSKKDYKKFNEEKSRSYEDDISLLLLKIKDYSYSNNQKKIDETRYLIYKKINEAIKNGGSIRLKNIVTDFLNEEARMYESNLSKMKYKDTVNKTTFFKIQKNKYINVMNIIEKLNEDANKQKHNQIY